MKKILIVLLSLLFVSAIVGCTNDSKNPEKLDGATLKQHISEILDDVSLSDLDKVEKLLPYMVEKAISYNRNYDDLEITDEYNDYLISGLQYLARLPQQTLSADEKNQYLAILENHIVNEELSAGKLEIYGWLYKNAVETLPTVTLDKNPQKKIGKWTEAEKAAAIQSADNYAKVIDKLADVKGLGDKVTTVLFSRDPLAMMIITVRTEKNHPGTAFSYELLDELADSPLKVLGYAEFFTGEERAHFFKCFPKTRNGLLAFHFMKVRLDPKSGKNLSIYAKLIPLAKTVADMEITPEFKALYEEFMESNGDFKNTSVQRELMTLIVGTDYSAIAVADLLTKPTDPVDGTYIMSVNPSGNKDFNKKSDNFNILKSYVDKNSFLKEAPLENAKYLIYVTYKNAKTNYFYREQGNKKAKKTWIKKLSGTLTIYDRTSGAKVATIPFSSKKSPKSVQYWDVDYYAVPNLELANDDFYTKLNAAIEKMK